MPNSKMITCLWFDKGEARKAAEFYASVFPDTRLGSGHDASSDFPGGTEGEELTVKKMNGKTWIVDSKGGSSMVTISNVHQSNGVIHVVDTVLMPAS